MRATINKLRRSVALRGITGTIAMCAVGVISVIHPTARRVELMRREADAAFDRELGVETGGVFRPEPDDVRGKNWRYGIRYQAVDPKALSETLRGLPIKHSDFTFVDFGSGKGRAVLIAADFPFQKVIGVEYCKKLNHTAQQNLSRRPLKDSGCNQIELVHGDATEFALPDDPLVLFFFNPFGRPVMKRVAENVTVSFQKNPRRMIVVYFTPYEAALWQQTGIFKKLRESPAIFDTDNTT
jgi:hypothetical protein